MIPIADTKRSFHVESAKKRNEKADGIKKAWREGQAPDALAALANDPDLAADRQLAVDLAYEEYCTRQEAGEQVDPELFCSRFPFRHSLLQLLNLHHFLDEHPDILNRVPTHWPAPGDTVGDFLLIRELGRGGYARVYLCEELTTGGRPVVVKLSSTETREAKTLGPLSHPHLIPVLSSPTIGGWNAVAMPFVGSATLENVIAVAWGPGQARHPRYGQTVLDAAKSGIHPADPPFTSCAAYPINPRRSYEEAIAAIAASLFSGLAYLHKSNIAHRDLKPSNVLLSANGHPYLLDFNLATDGTDRIRLAGTLPYMSPEQLVMLTEEHADPPKDWRPTDLFACGVVLFELLTGQHPFVDFQKQDVKASHEKLASALLCSQSKSPDSLESLSPRVGNNIRSIVTRCLSFDPAQRPTAAEAAELLAPINSWLQRWKRTISILIAMVALLIVALALRNSKWNDEKPQIETETERQVVSDPIDPLDRGLQLYRQGEIGLAASEFHTVGKNRQDGKAFAFAAYCYMLRRDHLSAERAADYAIQLGYGLTDVYVNRAFSKLQLSKLREAAQDCNRALGLEPNQSAARYIRIDVELRQMLQGDALSTDTGEDVQWMMAGAQHPFDVWLKVADICALGMRQKIAFAFREAILTATTLSAWIKTAGIFVVIRNEISERRDKTLAAIREAIRGGALPDAVGKDPVLRECLQGDPEYRKALQTTRGNSQKSNRNNYLVNPIPNP